MQFFMKNALVALVFLLCFLLRRCKAVGCALGLAADGCGCCAASALGKVGLPLPLLVGRGGWRVAVGWT